METIAAVPAAQAAAFVAVKSLETTGREALARPPALILGDGRINALPFVQSLDQVARGVMQVSLSAPGGAGLIVAIDPNGAAAFKLSLTLPATVSIAEAIAVDARGAAQPVVVTANEIAVGGAAPLPILAVVIRLSAAEAILSGLTLSRT
jgi:hypothetical protein